MGSTADTVITDLAKGKSVDYNKFRLIYAWADNKTKERLRQLQSAYADRVENESKAR
jgi:hypothetical protein